MVLPRVLDSRNGASEALFSEGDRGGCNCSSLIFRRMRCFVGGDLFFVRSNQESEFPEIFASEQNSLRVSGIGSIAGGAAGRTATEDRGWTIGAILDSESLRPG